MNLSVQNGVVGNFVKANNKQTSQNGQNVTAAIGGAGAGLTAGIFMQSPNCRIISKIKSLGDNLTPKEIQAIKDATITAMKSSGLEKNGVKIINVTSKNVDEVATILSKNANFFKKFFPKETLETIFQRQAQIFADGGNAAFAFKTNQLLMPEVNNMSWSVFHEMGHAINKNFSKVGRALQGCRKLWLLSVPIALISLFKNKKAPGEKPQGAMDKTTTFIKNNAGKLSFLGFLPILIEEGMASLKGNKLASQLLNKSLASKVIKANKLAYLTYLVPAMAVGIGICVANKIRDKLADKSNQKVA